MKDPKFGWHYIWLIPAFVIIHTPYYIRKWYKQLTKKDKEKGITNMITNEEKAIALDIVHDTKLQDEIMADPNHPHKHLLDYVFDLELQKQLF